MALQGIKKIHFLYIFMQCIFIYFKKIQQMYFYLFGGEKEERFMLEEMLKRLTLFLLRMNCAP